MRQVEHSFVNEWRVLIKREEARRRLTLGKTFNVAQLNTRLIVFDKFLPRKKTKTGTWEPDRLFLAIETRSSLPTPQFSLFFFKENFFWLRNEVRQIIYARRT